MRDLHECLEVESCGHQFSTVLENDVLPLSGTGEELSTLSYPRA